MYIPLITEIDIHENGGEIETANHVDDLNVLEIKIADEGETANDAKDN